MVILTLLLPVAAVVPKSENDDQSRTPHCGVRSGACVDTARAKRFSGENHHILDMGTPRASFNPKREGKVPAHEAAPFTIPPFVRRGPCQVNNGLQVEPRRTTKPRLHRAVVTGRLSSPN